MVTVNGLQSFMTFDATSNTISLNNPIAGFYILDVVLTDQYGMASHNPLKIDVLPEVIQETVSTNSSSVSNTSSTSLTSQSLPSLSNLL